VDLSVATVVESEDATVYVPAAEAAYALAALFVAETATAYDAAAAVPGDVIVTVVDPLAAGLNSIVDATTLVLQPVGAFPCNANPDDPQPAESLFTTVTA
jgi:hypothetical protein